MTQTTPSHSQAVELARRFHDAYERLAPQFGYTTREDTRAFDPESPNGKLMTAVCAELTSQQEVAAPVGDWSIEYDNDTGPDDGGFWEWRTVTNGLTSYKADSEEDAINLRKILAASRVPVASLASPLEVAPAREPSGGHYTGFTNEKGEAVNVGASARGNHTIDIDLWRENEKVFETTLSSAEAYELSKAMASVCHFKNPLAASREQGVEAVGAVPGRMPRLFDKPQKTHYPQCTDCTLAYQDMADDCGWACDGKSGSESKRGMFIQRTAPPSSKTQDDLAGAGGEGVPVAHTPDTAPMYLALMEARIALLAHTSGAGIHAIALIDKVLNAAPSDECPKCGSVEWDRINRERGMHPSELPINRCNCGYEWSAK